MKWINSFPEVREVCYWHSASSSSYIFTFQLCMVAHHRSQVPVIPRTCEKREAWATCLGVAPPTVSWGLLHESSVRKIPHMLAYRTTWWRHFSIDSPSPQMTLACVNLKKKKMLASTVSLRSAWATEDPVFKNKQNKRCICFYTIRQLGSKGHKMPEKRQCVTIDRIMFLPKHADTHGLCAFLKD